MFKLNRLKSLASYIFKWLNSGLIMCAADMLSQTYVEERDWNTINKERTIKFTTIGILFSGPILAHWRTIMRKSISINASPLRVALQKTFTTQMFLAPPLNFGIIVFADALNGIMPTKTSIHNVLQGNFLTVMEKNYLVWLPMQFTGCMIRYSVVKFVFVNFVSFVWFAYLSLILME